MQLWTFDRFKKPRLCADAVSWDAEADRITLQSGSTRYSLAIDDPEAGRALAEQIGSLSDGAAPLWREVRESGPDTPWRQIATFLDTHSMIAEGWDGAAEAVDAQKRRVETLIGETAAAIRRQLPRVRQPSAARTARSAGRSKAQASNGGKRRDPFDAAAFPNFFEALIEIELDYLDTASPLTAAAARALLANLAACDSEPALEAALAAAGEVAGLSDEQDFAAHLWLIGRCIALSVGDNANRWAVPELPLLDLCSGLEFMRRLELLTRDTLARWPVNSYVTAIETLGGAESPLVAGPYIEQYHVTRRFVEIVAPLLSRRLARPLKALMYQYFGEEVGHEELESATCVSLGVTERALNLAVPLPLHFAFVDVLTQVARTDPVASFAAVMVIEGVFGEAPRMSLRLEAVGAANPEFLEAADEHEELNVSLNHNSISRDCFEHILAVSPQRQKQVVDRILFLLELNHRAWSGITEFYGPQTELALPGPLGTLVDRNS